MKYELEPDNRNCADEILLSDILSVANRLGRMSLTKDDYNAHGRFSAATMQARFGSWNSALERSGLSVKKRVNIPQDELLSDLKRAATELNTRVLSVQAYLRVGRFSAATIARAFGSWARALEDAGLEVSDQWHPKIADEDLMSNMASVWESLGRQPRKDDLRSPLSRFSPDSYARRFGSWRRALEHFVVTANEPVSQDMVAPPQRVIATASPSLLKQRTQRDPSWRLRFLVMRRDHFTCCACGRSPANEPSLVLHIDHVVPWGKGGETTIENLQTLCETCNIGKSDLDMHEASRAN